MRGRYRTSAVDDVSRFVMHGDLPRGKANYVFGGKAQPTIFGAPVQATPLAGYGTSAWHLDGSNDYFLFPAAYGVFFPAGNDFTARGWVQFDSLPSASASMQVIDIQKSASNANRFTILGNASDKFQVAIYDGAGSVLNFNSSLTIVAGTGYEVKVVTWNVAGTQWAALWVNGDFDILQTDGSWTNRSTSQDPDMDLAIGALADTGGQKLDGRVQDWQIGAIVDHSGLQKDAENTNWPRSRVCHHNVDVLGAPPSGANLIAQGPTAGFEYAVNDEAWYHYVFPKGFNYWAALSIMFEMFPQGAEAAKNISFDVDTVGMKVGKLVNGVDGTLQFVDESIPATQYEAFTLSIALDPATYTQDPLLNSLHFEPTRVAAAADPTSRPAIAHFGLTHEKWEW